MFPWSLQRRNGYARLGGMRVFVWVVSLTASLGGFAFGYDTGCINGVKDMTGFRETFDFSMPNLSNASCTSEYNVKEGVILGVVVSVFSLGGFLGSLAAGAISSIAGRKIGILSGAAVYIVGGALQTASYYLWMMIIGRIVSGFGVGILFMVVPVYIAELAPSQLRGRLISTTSLALTLGILTGLVVNVGCSKFSSGWRVSLSVQCLVGLILLTGMAFSPETPRWLVKKQKEEQALKVLRRVRGDPLQSGDLQNELDAIIRAAQEKENQTVREKLLVLADWKVIQRIILGIILQLLNRLSGITVIMYYSVSIFCMIGIAPYITSIAIGSTNFLTTFQAIIFVDKVGRKPMLLFGALGMMVSMAIAAVLILVYRLDDEGGKLAAGYAVAVLLCVFVYSYSSTWGPITWVVNSEIHLMKTRGAAVSLTSSAFWIGNFIIAQVTPILLASFLKTFGTFFVLVGIHVFALLFALLTLPETKGVGLEKIDALFSKPWLERVNVFFYLRCGCLTSCCFRGRVAHQDYRGETGDRSVHARDPTAVIGSVNSGRRGSQTEETGITGLTV